MTRTIILVEDHAPVRELYAEALRGAGWRVIERPSAQGLLTLIRHEAADAVVVDWTLPGPSGLDALRAIKQDRGNPARARARAYGALGLVAARGGAGRWR